ncbi:putative ribonuclease H-like domain-containing protein [Tanacetum coccineum]
MSILMNKKYYLVVTDDYSRFTWVFFRAIKDETSGILKRFITEIENLVDKKVKIIRCDNGTEFKNKVMSVFCEQKGINREFSIARTPQQNGVAERRNRTLIEAARTVLADSNLGSTILMQNDLLLELDYEYVVMNPTSLGFAAVLAFLVTEASQNRQHGKSESDSYYLSD